jgi:LysR family glycine cleavage system transcriptional activator
MERPPLNALQVFVAAARAQNMTRAATRLHLTVSALSHQVRSLEQRLGCTLFVRGPRGLKLTPEGAMLLQRIAPHLDAIDVALQPMCARRDCALSISSLPSLASSWLVPRLPRFVAQVPGLEFNLDSSIERVDFADGRFDGALRYGPGTWDGVNIERLFEEWLTPVASPSLLESRGRPRLEQLGEWPLLAPDDPWPRWFEQFGGTEPKRYVATFSDSDTLQRATVEGMGVSLGRATLMRPLVESGRLVALFPQRMKARYAHYLVYPDRSREHAGFKAFREWLLAEAAAFRDAAANDERAAGQPPDAMPAVLRPARRSKGGARSAEGSPRRKRPVA